MVGNSMGLHRLNTTPMLCNKALKCLTIFLFAYFYISNPVFKLFNMFVE